MLRIHMLGVAAVDCRFSLLRCALFLRVVRNPRFGQLYHIAELAKPKRGDPRERRSVCACWSRQISLGWKVW